MRNPLRSKPSDEDGVVSPYLMARRTWNDHTGGLAESRRLWQWVAMSAVLMAMAAVGGLVSVAQKSKFVPYVVALPSIGLPVAVGPANVAAKADRQVIQAYVADFVESARMVSSDADLEKKAVFRVFAMMHTKDLSYKKMSDWFSATPESSPFSKASKETVNVAITSVIPQSAQTWQVDWIETTYSRGDSSSEAPPSGPPTAAGGVAQHMRALVTVDASGNDAKTTEQQIRSNPLGLFVTDFSWAKVN